MSPARRPLAVLALLAPLLLVGCGGSDSTGSTASADGAGATTSSSPAGGAEGPAKAVDLCPLVTAADMSTLLGYEVAFKRDPSNGSSYDSVKADARTEPSVSLMNVLQVEGNGGLAGAKAGAAATTGGGVPVDLPGIGDGAFVVTSGANAQFNACLAAAEAKGQQVTVTVVGGGEANRAKLAPVAQKVLELAVSKL